MEVLLELRVVRHETLRLRVLRCKEDEGESPGSSDVKGRTSRRWTKTAGRPGTKLPWQTSGLPPRTSMSAQTPCTDAPSGPDNSNRSASERPYPTSDPARSESVANSVWVVPGGPRKDGNLTPPPARVPEDMRDLIPGGRGTGAGTRPGRGRPAPCMTPRTHAARDTVRDGPSPARPFETSAHARPAPSRPGPRRTSLAHPFRGEPPD